MGEGIGLAEFIAALRAELSEAQEAAKDDPLKLTVGTVELTMQVAYTRETTGEVDGTVKAKFWVLELGAGIGGSARSEDVQTQQLKLVLTPRVTVSRPEGGAQQTSVAGLDVSGTSGINEDSGESAGKPTSSR